MGMRQGVGVFGCLYAVLCGEIMFYGLVREDWSSAWLYRYGRKAYSVILEALPFSTNLAYLLPVVFRVE